MGPGLRRIRSTGLAVALLATLGAPAPTTPAAASTRAAPVIIDFATPTPQDASASGLGGASLIFPWSQLEPHPGVYRWGAVDRDLAVWRARGKVVVLRVVAATQREFEPGVPSATPGWLWDEGLPSVREQDGTVLPVYWNPRFERAWKAFVLALGRRYDGSPTIAYVEAGIGEDGETLVDTESQYTKSQRLAVWAPAGYTDEVWLATAERFVADFGAAFPTTPVSVMVDSSFLGPDAATDLDRLVGWVRQRYPAMILQDNGLETTSTVPADWQGADLAEEQRTSVAGSDAVRTAAAAALCRQARAMGASYVLLYRRELFAGATPLGLDACRAAMATGP